MRIKPMNDSEKENFKKVINGLILYYENKRKVKQNQNNNLIDSQDSFVFGYIKNGKLFWTDKLNQLAYAIYEIHEKLGLEKITAYSIKEEIVNSNKIIFKGSQNSIKNCLEKLLSGKQDFHKSEFVKEASKIILALIKSK